MSGHKTASVVFLLLTLVIALVLSGIPSSPTSYPTPEAAKKKSSGCAKKIMKAKPPAPPATPATPADQLPRTFTPFSDVGTSGSTYGAAYAPTTTPSPVLGNTREFEYLITPMH
jgi:hypothetical protein